MAIDMTTVKKIQIPSNTYELLEYVQFNGNDYIDSGYTPWNNFSYYLDIQWDRGSINQYSGHGKVTSDNRCFVGVDNNGKITFGTGAYSASISNSDPYTRHTYLVRTGPSSGTGVFDIDGVQQWWGASNYVESNRGTMFIGGVYRSTGDYSLCRAKIYNVKFTNNAATATTWTWNLIPVRRKTDGVVGFLKLKASGTTPDFMTSVNGLLEAGPVVGPYMIDLKKIENSNGDIIWGSQSAFPYRRLEYIHFSGSERIDTGMKPQVHFYYLNCKVQTRTDAWSFIWGAAAHINNTFFRLFWQGNTDGRLNPRLKNTNTDYVSGTENKIIQLRLRNYATNNSTGTYWWACQDLNGDGLSDGDGTTEMKSKYYNSSTYACNFNNFNTTIAIGQYHTDDSWTAAEAQAIMDVYRYFIRDNTGTSTIVNDQYPCQRKSDGKCGLYDIITGTFYPMQGTNITDSAAGPVVDEYWDLTAPD